MKSKAKTKNKEQASFIKNSFKNDFFFFTMLSILCLILYWKPVSQAPILNFDDRSLLLPMEKVHSLSDYIKLWADNAVLDLQPIRDLSYILEYRISDIIEFKIHPQFVNIILWLIAIYLIYKIAILQGLSVVESKLAVTFIALHPVAVNSIAWSASRKHILSLLFISAATLLWLRFLSGNKKISFGAIFLYLLSCLSQPINVGWFLWAGFIAKFSVATPGDSEERFKRAIPNLAMFGLIGLMTVAANLWYYASERYLDSLGTKFINEGFDVIGNRLLTFGRFFFQLLIPIRPSITSYDPTSLIAGVGILLLPLYCFLIWKLNKNKTPIYTWGLFTILPLLVVNGPSNHHFGWDTYLLTPLFGWTFLLVFTIKSLLERKILSEKSISILTLTLLSLFSIQTKISSDAWQDDETIWTRSVNTERTQASLAGFVKTNLSLRKNIQEMWLFLGRAAHQIKTPVTAMQATLQVLLRRDRSKEELLGGLEDVQSAADLLNNLTRKLMSSSRISYEERPPTEAIELKFIFKEMLEFFKSKSEMSGIQIKIESDTPLKVLADRTLMTDIFGNLIENAILYSPENKNAQILISWRPEHARAIIEIKDQGQGFPETIKADLFKPFIRGDERKIIGSGLGLSIAKKSVNLLNGDIELVESTASGSVMRVWLPIG
jgi:signal transduction histidine kinase